MVEPDRPRITVWRMCFTCWTDKVTNTQSEYVALIAFPLQHWLLESTSMLRYTYIVCLVNTAVARVIDVQETCQAHKCREGNVSAK